ncbi:MAG: hypothetical protein RSC20_01165, partial [Clostridiales bacterium]
IFGIKKCDKPGESAICFKLGCVLMALSLFSSIMGMWQQGLSVSGVCSLLFGLLLPILFCYGAVLNQKSVN